MGYRDAQTNYDLTEPQMKLLREQYERLKAAPNASPAELRRLEEQIDALNQRRALLLQQIEASWSMKNRYDQ